jgi:hypothetical protein
MDKVNFDQNYDLPNLNTVDPAELLGIYCSTFYFTKFMHYYFIFGTRAAILVIIQYIYFLKDN